MPDEPYGSDRSPESDEPVMVEERSLDEFRSYGLLILVNSILHWFGWVLAFNPEAPEQGLKPYRTKFRGFAEETQAEGFAGFARFLREKGLEVAQETEDELKNEEAS